MAKAANEQQDRDDGAGNQADMPVPTTIAEIKDLAGMFGDKQDPTLIYTVIKLVRFSADDEENERMRADLESKAKNRFMYRRKLAYWSFYALLAMGGIVLFFAFVDETRGTGLIDRLKDMESFLTWGAGFLASIVGFYFGSSALRPTS